MESGEVEGSADFGSASARLSGRQLRRLLDGLGGDETSPNIVVERTGFDDQATLQVAIDDDGEYSAWALEV